MKKILIFLFLFIYAVSNGQDTTHAFWKDIAHFKHLDSFQKAPDHPILFVGSSSFTRWTDVQNYFPGYTILNRGFGGSRLTDVLYFEEDVIFKYKPKQIVIYAGENDVASSDTVTGQVVFQRFKKLFTDIRSRMPGIPIVYVSMKPSPSRWHLQDKLTEGNQLIEAFLKKQKHTHFINVGPAMLGADGKPMESLFVEDRLHMNTSGYAIWQKLLTPYLLK